MEDKIVIKNEVCTSKISNEEIIEFTVNRELSPYAKFFNEHCPGWSKDSEMNLHFLRHMEQYATELLRSRGYLFLNEVYDMLGIPRTKTGQVVGWVYDPENPVGDNCVDFDIYSERNEEFVNGYERSALLDFNVDGDILGYLKD